TYTDLFSLIKDTTPPQISVTYSTPSVWYTEYPGDVGGLRFDEAMSGLARVQYSVSASKLFADGAVIPWTDLTVPPLTPGATWYEPVLTYSFAQLANAASNYFSFRAVDLAGSTRTVVDAFGIGKNVSGPVVNITTPTLAFLSTFTWLSGSALPTNAHPVLGTEVSLRDMVSGLYYNGVSFLSGARVWREADDAASTFTITLANLPLVSGRQYQAVARSSDSVGDYSQVFSTYAFTFDAQPPAALILYPADGSLAPSAAAISGTASDAASGITSVEVALKRLSDGKWWKNSVSSWDTTPEPLQAGTTPYWTWNFNAYLRDSLPDGASFYATVRAWDNSNPRNYGPLHVSGSTFTYVDATPPPATLTLSAAPGTFSGSARLSWRTAGDNAANGYLLDGRYKIAYSTWAGAQVSTAGAQVTLTTATLTAGSTQYATVTGLTPSASYYFTLWTADDALNWSAASNEAAAMSGAPDSGSLSGRVTDAAANPVTGVLVEARSASGAVEGSDYTDVHGNYSIPALNSLYLSVRAVWAAQDIESSVTKDQVANGSPNVNFTLSVSYQLASISGFIPANFLLKTSARPSGLYTTREVDTRTSGAFVEIYRKGRRIGAAFAGEDGAFSVPNLLPGTYSLRVYNGSDYSVMQAVTLRPGENLVFTPRWTLNKDKVYAYPNPANTLVHFHFEPVSAVFEAEVQVFDVAGRLVKRLAEVLPDAVVGGGTKRISWDLSRESVASGVYLYILRLKDPATGKTDKVVKKFAVIR
ncbi:MAG: T9SS type A sorting domain-containing protein, partial [Elusimicrobiales bacterium]|nr:T9SS type A sorting domain-containing protein [Elusimicrobiales bacterium]